MENAIKLAIEKGGYKPEGYSFNGYSPAQKTQAIVKMKFKERIVCDPLFWKSLGKALDLSTKAKEMSDGSLRVLMIGWEDFALHYFRLLFQGGDTEKFWRDILHQ